MTIDTLVVVIKTNANPACSEWRHQTLVRRAHVSPFFLSSQLRLAYHLRGGQTSFQFHIAGFRSAISSAVRAYILRNPLVRGTEYWNERIRTTHIVLRTSERML